MMMRAVMMATVAGVALASLVARGDTVAGSEFPRDDVPPACFDDSDVVGYRSCPHYAAWGDNLRDAYFVVENGLNWRVFPDAAQPAAVARSTTGVSTQPSSVRRRDHVLTLDERFVRPFGSTLYGALDFEFGNLLVDSTGRDLETDALASIGLRVSLGPAAFAAELAGGGRLYNYVGEATMHGEGVLEARARASVWLGPWVTIGPMVGTSLVTRGEWVAGGFIAFHSRTYAGER
jgi:hypothetical protein